MAIFSPQDPEAAANIWSCCLALSCCRAWPGSGCAFLMAASPPSFWQAIRCATLTGTVCNLSGSKVAPPLPRKISALSKSRIKLYNYQLVARPLLLPPRFILRLQSANAANPADQADTISRFGRRGQVMAQSVAGRESGILDTDHSFEQKKQ